MKCSTLLFAGLISIVACKHRDRPTVGSVAGTVRDSVGRPLPMSFVDFRDTLLGAVTDSLGSFHLRGVPAGEHSVRVAHLCYLPLRDERIIVVAGDTVRYNWVLLPIPAAQLSDQAVGCPSIVEDPSILLPTK